MSFEKAKSITFALVYLTDALKKKKKKLSAKELASEINKHGSGVIDGGKISAILRGWHLPPQEMDDLHEALQKLIEARKLGLDLSDIPPGLAAQYELPAIFRNNVPHGLQGEVIGDLASNMAGGWSFYYVSPIDRAGEIASEVRSTAAYIYPTTPDARSMDIRMVSTRGIWNGNLFTTGPHLYVVLNDIAKNDVRKTETIFFIVNRPHSKRPFIAGIGTALIRSTNLSVPPVFGFLFFGEKHIPTGTSKRDKSADPLIKKFFESSPPDEADLGKIRSEACLSFSWEEFEQNRPRLAAYIKTLEVNGAALGKEVPGLHLRWP
ncbi:MULTISPECIES: hypothetical protein [Bradyrhizobium]|uniref:Uncharacterized protein n=2 Tax=Bradyrhizobium TaxID=374 RepID=A0ABY0PLZ8_9BRAD|nr:MULTISPECIES: hypothetical protein [Bradyrhizobium]SDI63110.1 hypothetical protein SAMN05444163_3308 [Bradyrhizobium ottawaense]SED34518.1 hypothetical protein SAMN05444171_3860 [Bradyrhizobium lablabi]